jgi:protein-tyrosine phosphatase
MKILIVCLGNICRSPMAEGILRDMIQKQGLASPPIPRAPDYHVGEAPDQRAIRSHARTWHRHQRSARAALRSRDFDRFDLLLAMDARATWNMLAWHRNEAS